MVETYFTPGPWVVGSNNPDGDDPYGPIPIRAGHYRIAKLGLDDAPVHDYNTMQRCNARLISAAPDLYEALEALAAGEPDLSGVSLVYDADVQAILSMARHALAKARGWE